jgi:hypothetical protein
LHDLARRYALATAATCGFLALSRANWMLWSRA